MGALLKGLPASPGIAIARAWLRDPPPRAGGAPEARVSGGAEAEWERWLRALEASRAELAGLRDSTRERLGALKAEIFDAHLSMLRDPELAEAVSRGVREEGLDASAALEAAVRDFAAALESLDGELFRARADDLRDLGARIGRHLAGEGAGCAAPEAGACGPEGLVVFARSLTPSETAALDLSVVRAFVTAEGSLASHSTILARSLGIPAVVGLGAEALSSVAGGAMVVVDGLRGLVALDPDEAELSAYRERAAGAAEAEAETRRWATAPTRTRDGGGLELVANIGSPRDCQPALARGAEGVGLFRTEFLFMDRADLPSEAEQREAYREALAAFAPRPVTIRTLDIGGDKEVPALALPKEENPFLGLRALRLCLAREDLFRTQLRALLGAAEAGRLRIMFPMVATLGELRAAKAILEEERRALLSRGLPLPQDIEVGVMIEIPAAAAMADLLAKEADFFSVGTNDLTQYMMAADRMNPALARLSDPLHPALLRVMGEVARAARARGRRAAVCGEMAADPAALPLLVGMGFDELSMGAASIPGTRAALSRIDRASARELWMEAKDLEGAEEVRALVAARMEDRNGGRR